MGTLFDQPVKLRPSLMDNLYAVEAAFKKLMEPGHLNAKLTVTDALKMIELAIKMGDQEQECDFQNTLDEQLSGFGKLFDTLNDTLSSLSDNIAEGQ